MRRLIPAFVVLLFAVPAFAARPAPAGANLATRMAAHLAHPQSVGALERALRGLSRIHLGHADRLMDSSSSPTASQLALPSDVVTNGGGTETSVSSGGGPFAADHHSWTNFQGGVAVVFPETNTQVAYQGSVFSDAPSAQAYMQDGLSTVTPMSTGGTADCSHTFNAPCTIVLYSPSSGNTGVYAVTQVNQCVVEVGYSGDVSTISNSADSLTRISSTVQALGVRQAEIACGDGSTTPPSTGPGTGYNFCQPPPIYCATSTPDAPLCQPQSPPVSDPGGPVQPFAGSHTEAQSPPAASAGPGPHPANTPAAGTPGALGSGCLPAPGCAFDWPGGGTQPQPQATPQATYAGGWVAVCPIGTWPSPNGAAATATATTTTSTNSTATATVTATPQPTAWSPPAAAAPTSTGTPPSVSVVGTKITHRSGGRVASVVSLGFKQEATFSVTFSAANADGITPSATVTILKGVQTLIQPVPMQIDTSASGTVTAHVQIRFNKPADVGRLTARFDIQVGSTTASATQNFTVKRRP